jgi:membrane fusion protein (multidrug efflux system)
MRKLRIASVLGLSACLGFGLLTAGCGPKKPKGDTKPGAANVGYVVITPKDVALNTELAGRTSAFLVSEVRPQTSGIITRRLFTEGAMVKEGQPLYQIDPGQAQATLSAARAALAQAEANRDAARLKADRYGELIKIKAISQQEFDDAQTSLSLTTAAVASQKAAVEAATLGLRYTEVRAPISGRIGASSVTPGALVTANQATALTTVQDISTLYVDLNQSASETLSLRAALQSGDLTRAAGPAPVSLVLYDGTVYPQKGTLAFSDASADEGTGTVRLRALFPNPDGFLLPGMYVRARLTKGLVQQGLLVPQAGVSRNPRGAATAYVVGPDNKAHLKTITVTEMVGPNWLVSAGLAPGDKVIVEGLLNVRPNTKVKATPAKAPVKGPGDVSSGPTSGSESASMPKPQSQPKS